MTTDGMGQTTMGGQILTGVAWDLKRGGAAHDVRDPAARVRLQAQVAKSGVTWWAPECRTFSRARGKPVPGASHWPPALRSTAHPYGLPGLNQPHRATDRAKVETGNLIMMITFADATAAARRGQGVAIENPANSFMWILPETMALAALPGMTVIEFMNCMFDGGMRNKRTKVLTNVPEIAHALANKMCMGRELCDRTGRPHLSWAPTVRDGTIQAYATDGEAEYPMGLCTAVGDAMVIRRAASTDPPPEIEFTEVFAGPRAVLSAGVSQRLAAGSAASSASSSSAPSA